MRRQTERSNATIGAILAAARKLFATKGFDSTSIDDIGSKAGVAKGAVYHHFASKEAIFTRVLEEVQAQIAATPPPASARKIADPMDTIAAGVQRYLNAATAPDVKRILLIDGPAVIGWLKWREIDDRFFGAGARRAVAYLLSKESGDKEVEVLTHLIMGAVMEAALVCANAEDSRKAARDLAAALRKMLTGVRASTDGD
jgi:AcrR family transcriptional regulator